MEKTCLESGDDTRSLQERRLTAAIGRRFDMAIEVEQYFIDEKAYLSATIYKMGSPLIASTASASNVASAPPSKKVRRA